MSVPTPLYDPCEARDFLSRKDNRLAKVIAEVGTCTIMSRRRMTPFKALMRSIVFQQLSGKAAGTIWGRVLDACPCKGPSKPEAVLSVSYETLRAAVQRTTTQRRQGRQETLSNRWGTVLNVRRATDEDWVEIREIFREVIASGDTYVFNPDMGEVEAVISGCQAGPGLMWPKTVRALWGH